MEKKEFLKGFKDGIPIGLGYLSVSISIGIMAVGSGLSVISSLLISMTNLTSAGQVAGISVIASGGTLIEIALTQLVINMRYSLMGISLSQKADVNFTTPHRMFLGAFITDEIFGVASSRAGDINTAYMYGLIIVPYIGWAAGTLIGSVMGKLLPPAIYAALGLAIYGMFIAIVVPAMKKSREIAFAVLIAAAISTAIHFIPLLSGIGFGFSVIISSLVASVIMAFISVRRRQDK
ncbi:MAG: AzlC family ABC transporter permease [Bacillota bacterium]|nr:AzlC family ABC transporter permease [Bacillota bacterium]